MTDSSNRRLSEEIRSAFSDVGLHKVDSSILSKCVAVASTLNLKPEKLAEYWEAHSLNKNVNELSEHTFQGFRSLVMKEADFALDTAVISRPKREGLPMVTPPPKRQSPNTTLESPTQRRVSVSPQKNPVTPKTLLLPSYNERQGAGNVVTVFNPNNLPSTTTRPSDSKHRCVVSAPYDTNVKKPYRHMFTPIEERARVLDDQLANMTEEMMETFGIGKESSNRAELEAVGVPRQEKICCVGRICNEAHEGRINHTSVLLEGSRHYSGGTRINLDLSELKSGKQSFSLFPGQIVAVEGMNPSGRKMVAHAICEGSAPPSPKTNTVDLLKMHHDTQDGQPLKLLHASGPYTTSDNLDYEPLVDLMGVVKEERPDVVVLAGPFVDIANQDTALELDDGSKLHVTYEVFFANKIAALIEELFESEPSLQTQFVLVPSLDDAVAEWVYPQAPLSDRLPNGGSQLKLPGAEGIENGTLGLQHVETVGRESVGPKRIHCVSNPCTFRINEIVVGVTSTDAIFHMSADETNANLEPGSRLGRIAQHLVQQRSFYPLFPPSANLDLRRMHEWTMPVQPDLLIVPSKLTSFVRTVLESTVVVNPGHLSRGTTGGTYALMDVHPMKRETLESAGGETVEMAHSLPDRVRVEIKRI